MFFYICDYSQFHDGVTIYGFKILLNQVIKKFRDDEQSHHDIGLAHGAEEAPGYNFLTAVIGFGCRNAIWISERI